MLTLGIETSGREASIALRQDGHTVSERVLGDPSQRHAQTLVAQIDQSLRELGREPRDCDLIAVSIGPGSFTGLRIGVVCAKTLAYATGCKIAAVDTFAAVAENSPDDVEHLYVVADAQRQDLYCGSYRRADDGRFEREDKIAIVAVSKWLSDRRAGDMVSGPGLAKVESDLAGICRALPKPFRKPNAARIAELGERIGRSDASEDFWKLEPFYLRKSAAEEKRDAEEHGAGNAQRL